MAYKKHEWKARQGTGLNKFRDQDGKLYEFTSAPDSVTQPGTPFSADWMNEMEDGIAAAGITNLSSSAASGATAITITENAPDTVAAGDHFRIYFINAVGAGAALNIGGTGAKPIINNYSGTAVVSGDIPADYVADIVYNGTEYILLNAMVVSGTPTGYAFFTSDGSFTVPNFVTAVKISACAAGVGRYAGEYIVDRIYNVTPGQKIDLTIGTGNTVIGSLVTLVAGSVSSALATTKLGYAAGYNGGDGGTTNTNTVPNGYGGYGGAFGFGGGGGGGMIITTASDYGYPGGSGAGIGGAGKSGGNKVTGTIAGGGSTGGAGGAGSNDNTLVSTDGGDATNGNLIYSGVSNGVGTKGGDGSIYGGGGGGGGNCRVENGHGGGGAAGGDGAGGGTCGGDRATIGQPSGGMVLIEWGGAVA